MFQFCEPNLQLIGAIVARILNEINKGLAWVLGDIGCVEDRLPYLEIRRVVTPLEAFRRLNDDFSGLLAVILVGLLQELGTILVYKRHGQSFGRTDLWLGLHRIEYVQG